MTVASQVQPDFTEISLYLFIHALNIRPDFLNNLQSYRCILYKNLIN